ncbi:MAG: NADH-quinone oxidoreductase subunit C [Pseudomonadota bacterium]
MANADYEALRGVGELVAAQNPDAVIEVQSAFGEVTLIAEPGHIVELVKFLRDSPACAFTTLVDICGVDYPGRDRRFDVVYHFLSIPLNLRIRVKARVREGEPIPSIIAVFPTADWFEREAFDMYGILFAGHPDLRRILTDYGFRGYPLRKDFPTTGYVELRYDETAKRVVYEPVKLVQEYRQFDFLSPWEGAKYVLPGD